MRNLSEIFVAFRFGIIGGLATLIHLLVSMLAIHWLFESAVYANLLGYFVGLPFSYLGHAYFTFRGAPTWRQFFHFAAGNTMLLVISLVTAFVLDRLDCNKYISTAVSVFVFPVLSFLLHSKVTFRKDS